MAITADWNLCGPPLKEQQHRIVKLREHQDQEILENLFSFFSAPPPHTFLPILRSRNDNKEDGSLFSLFFLLSIKLLTSY
jgi:hypothetical protein